MERISFSVQPFELSRSHSPFELSFLVARESHLAPPAGTVLMTTGSRTFLLEDRKVVIPLSADNFVIHPRPAYVNVNMDELPGLDAGDPPQVHLRDALMRCKRAGVRASQIQEIWDEFVTRQVLED